MKVIATRRRVGLGAIVLLFGMMVAVIPSYALPYGTSAVSGAGKTKTRGEALYPKVMC
jgi:hypothetical protein